MVKELDDKIISGPSANGLNNKWTIVPNGPGVSLKVIHTCMHVGSYYFAAAEFAKNELSRFESNKCLMCRSNDEVERVKQL